MSSNLRKCISLSPAGMTRPWSNQDYRNPENRAWFAETNTRWVRMWFNWVEYLTPGGESKLHELDAQIRTARDDGRKVVLCFMQHYPVFFSEAPAGSQNPRYFPADRGVGGPWAGMLRDLYNRYKPFGPENTTGAVINLLEVINEPNVTHEVAASDDPVPKVVDMLQTAQAISAQFDHQLHIGGPALSDDPAAYADYVDRLFADMDRRGFRAHAEFVWTHHNYTEVERDRPSTVTVRDRLVTKGWTGYDEGDGPVVFCTEGGARLLRADQRAPYEDQAIRVTVAFDRLKGAARVGMQTNYLLYDDPNWEQPGLRGVDGWRRPVYDAWIPLTSGASDLHAWRRRHLLAPHTQWDPAVCSQRPGHLEVFAVGTDRKVWSSWSGNSGGSWSSWNDLGGSCSSAPGAISIHDGAMSMFVLGDRGELWERWWRAGQPWSNWANLGGSSASDPAVASFNAQHMQVFTRWHDGTLWHRWWWQNGGWSSWHQLWGGQVAGSPSAVSWADGRMDVVFRGHDNRVHHMFFNGAWNGPFPLPGGAGAVGHPEITSWKHGHLDVICGGTDGRLHRLTWDHGVWSNWHRIPHTGDRLASPGAVSPDRGQIDLFFQRPGSQIQHVSFSA